MISNSIREMNYEDIPTVIKNDIALLGETLGETIIKQHLSSDLMKCFIMESDQSDFMGMISLWIDLDKCQINNFYIVSKYQKQKLSKVFMDYILKYLSNIGVKEITLEVKKSNFIAIKLYESYGFHQVSVRRNYYNNGEDALLMYLRIGSD